MPETFTNTPFLTGRFDRALGYASEHPSVQHAGAQHHVGPIVALDTHLTDPLIALSAVAAVTNRLELGTAIYLLETWNPAIQQDARRDQPSAAAAWRAWGGGAARMGYRGGADFAPPGAPLTLGWRSKPRGNRYC